MASTAIMGDGDMTPNVHKCSVSFQKDAGQHTRLVNS